MKRRFTLLVIVVAAAAVAWEIESAGGVRLQRQLDDARRQSRRLASLRTEHERLAAAQPSRTEWDELLRDAAEASRLRKIIDDLPSAAAPTSVGPVSTSLPPARNDPWVTAAEWKNRGRATPADTLETLFWAAANGDVGLLRNALELSPEIRAVLQATLARLERSRAATPASYSGPEDLAALFATHDWLAERFRLVWVQSQDSDHAAEAVMLQTAEGKTKGATLSLHRIAGEWRIVMPLAYAKKIADELAGPPATVATDLESPHP